MKPKKKKNYVQYSTDLNKKFDNKRTIIYVKIFLLLYFNEKKNCYVFKQNTLQVNE